MDGIQRLLCSIRRFLDGRCLQCGRILWIVHGVQRCPRCDLGVNPERVEHGAGGSGNGGA